MRQPRLPPSGSPRPGRRAFLAAGAAAVGLATAGCLGWFDDELTFEAAAATATDATIEATGYEHVETRSVEVTETFEAAGQSEDATTVNRIAEYEKRVELPFGSERAAVFAALATPQVEVLGERFNPVGDMSTRELAELLQEQYDEFGDLEHEADGTVTVLGAETTRSRFVGEARLRAGLRVDIDIHLTEAVASEDDYVVCLGAFPSVLEGELDDVEAMMGGLDHPT